MNGLARNLAFLLRQAARRPMLHVLVVFILALGIGANTAMFTLTDSVLYRDLPVHDPRTLVRIFSTNERGGEITNGSYPGHVFVRDNAAGIIDAAAYTESYMLQVDWQRGAPERAEAGLASGNFFAVLGIEPRLGHLVLDDNDSVEDGRAVAVLSHHAWRTRLDGDPDVIGRTITVNRNPYTVIGVLPPEFGGMDVNNRPLVWLPLAMARQLVQGIPGDAIFSERMSWLDTVARLAPGVTPQQLQAELDALAQPVAEERERQSVTSGVGPWRRVLPAREAAVDPYGNLHLARNALLLTGIVALVLLLACTNVAGLMLVRAESRARELAIRASVGASRFDLVRMMLAETLFLALAGALAGFALAQLLLRWLVAEAPRGVVLPLDPASALGDSRVLLATAAVAIAVTVVVGLVPALRAARVDPNVELKGGASGSGVRRAGLWRAGLVGVQVGMSAVILVGAGLLLRSFWNIAQVDPGFSPQGAVTVAVDVSAYDIANGERQSLLQRISERAATLPGVSAAGFSQTVPVQSGGWRTTVEPEDAGAPPGDEIRSDLFIVTPGFVDALGARLLDGRDIVAADMRPDAEPVALVNETLAATLWPGEDALGRRIINDARVVGIVSDHMTRGLGEPAPPIVYATMPRFNATSMTLVVRAARDPLTLLAELRAAIRDIDPALPLYRERTLAEHLARSYAQVRTFAWLLGGFAGLALLLAAAGLYGLFAHALRLRQREFGIRMALGAGSASIAVLVARQVVLLVGAGLLAGLLAALFAGRLLEGLLFGVPAFDIATFVAVVLVVAGAAVFATFMPIRRATVTQPMHVLREE